MFVLKCGIYIAWGPLGKSLAGSRSPLGEGKEREREDYQRLHFRSRYQLSYWIELVVNSWLRAMSCIEEGGLMVMKIPFREEPVPTYL